MGNKQSSDKSSGEVLVDRTSYQVSSTAEDFKMTATTYEKEEIYKGIQRNIESNFLYNQILDLIKKVNEGIEFYSFAPYREEVLNTLWNENEERKLTTDQVPIFFCLGSHEINPEKISDNIISWNSSKFPIQDENPDISKSFLKITHYRISNAAHYQKKSYVICLVTEPVHLTMISGRRKQGRLVFCCKTSVEGEASQDYSSSSQKYELQYLPLNTPTIEIFPPRESYYDLRGFREFTFERIRQRFGIHFGSLTKAAR